MPRRFANKIYQRVIYSRGGTCGAHKRNSYTFTLRCRYMCSRACKMQQGFYFPCYMYLYWPASSEPFSRRMLRKRSLILSNLRHLPLESFARLILVAIFRNKLSSLHLIDINNGWIIHKANMRSFLSPRYRLRKRGSLLHEYYKEYRLLMKARNRQLNLGANAALTWECH